MYPFLGRGEFWLRGKKGNDKEDSMLHGQRAEGSWRSAESICLTGDKDVDVRDASITVPNINVSRGGLLLLRNSTITGNLTANFTGILYFQNDSSVTVNGNVVCMAARYLIWVL
jgi:hypothetical protein